MKIIKYTKRVDRKDFRLKAWRLKTTLTIRKPKRHSTRKFTKMFILKNATMNIANDTNISAQSIPSGKNVSCFTQRTSRRLNSRHRRKQICDKETSDQSSSDNECVTDDITIYDNSKQQREFDISDEESEEVTDKWMQISFAEERNLDLPIVVKMDDSALSTMPKIFEQEQNRQSKVNMSYDRKSFMSETCSSEKKTLIISTECINLEDSVHSSVEHRKRPSWYANKTDRTEDNEVVMNVLRNVAVNSSNNASSSPARGEFIRSLIRSTSGNSDVETDSSHFEDTSALCYESDHNNEVEDNATTSNNTSQDIEVTNNSLDTSLVYREFPSREEPDQRTTGLQDPEVASESVRKYKKPQLYNIRNIVIVIMESCSRFSFNGKLLVKVLYGAVEVYGAVLDASNGPSPVYSPWGYSSVVVETSKESPAAKGSIDDIWTVLSAEGIIQHSESKLRKDINKVESGTAVLVLRNFDNNLTYFLKAHSSLGLFPKVKKSGYYPWTHHHRAEVVLQAQLRYVQRDSPTCRQLVSSLAINQIVEKMLVCWHTNSWSCTMIAGGKNVGKSTSVRFLINKLLRTCGKVVLVDVDPGQAECTPAGCVSYSLIEQPLMGPNFTHLQTPVYQLFIDEINVARCVPRYLQSLKMLIDKLKQCPELSRLPIVVNTMGFTQYIGLDLAIFMVKLVRPSIILQILSSKKRNNYAHLLNADVVNQQKCKWNVIDDWDSPCDHELCVIHSNAENELTRATNELSIEPYQQRELVMISYLSGIVRDSYNHYENLSVSINETLPFMAPFSSLCIIPQRLLGVPDTHALSVINGNIVALCGIDLTKESAQVSDNTSSLRVLTQRSPLCTCYGFGIVRGVDMEQQLVFINTPLPISMMQHINCLAGSIPIPPTLLQLSHGAPYVGGDQTLPTSRVVRKGYFRMRSRKRPNNS
ncbi:polynucleotide 5'-hydroxyl-kinase NOL9 isoform X2 [Harpegnathos saltator]|uniref:polynucleotide 5'-hydroxyl-kinase NOL9 isoform X2 n=1 Tax=Harpegnathos saltator TaxID=610380 RepID=UPI00058CF4BE|nr:polynucleotide 5'-hydroxyl-kinase NOL9 isoform X2 [Harpegnathos saltator]